MAEREGFEPPIPFQVCRFSRPVPSTTRPPLRLIQFYYIQNEFARGSPARASRSHERTVAPLAVCLRDSRRAGWGKLKRYVDFRGRGHYDPAESTGAHSGSSWLSSSGGFPCVDINRKPIRSIKACFDQGHDHTPPPVAPRLPGLNDIRLLTVPQRNPVVGM
jgi:hypothetical protein